MPRCDRAVAPAGRLSTAARPASRLAALLALLICGADALGAQHAIGGTDDGTRRFGTGVTLLSNGHFLVRDPDWSGGGLLLAGAVYLFDAEGKQLSRLVGSSAGDRVGAGGIVLLANGDFVVRSPSWDAPGPIEDAGAVTFGDADTGFGVTAVVGAGNSLVGSSAGDRVGASGVVALDNGSYVVASGDWDRAGVAVNAGAVTWCAADGSRVGTIDAGNSLLGAQPEDRVGDVTLIGKPGVVALANGHYVVAAPRFDRAALVDAGAVTWARDDGSVVGEVGAANSLLGVRAGDLIGSEVQALSNGHYIVQSPFWSSASATSMGAVTWADGGAPTLGEVTAANSLVGDQAGDLVGYLAAVLSNGNYVVASPLWDRDAIVNAGAATWRDGSGPHPGVVDVGNSLVGSHPDDNVGFFTSIGIPPLGVVALDDGDYVVASPEWDGAEAADVGAATWGSGSSGVAGEISATNSLIGSTFDDAIAQFIVTLPGGRYVVASPYWNARAGAATWGGGDGAPVGVVGGDNSLIGTLPGDFVTASGVYRLRDGAYAVASERWSHGTVLRVGAVTRAGPDGIAGAVSPQNSIIGLAANDLVGRGGVESLPDGGFVLRSEQASRVGALTRVGGEHGSVSSPGVVMMSNSLLGNADDDAIGFPGVSAFADGAIVQHTAFGAMNESGAITLFDPESRFLGTLPEASTVRSEVAEGGPGLNYAYASATRTAIVGDPLANRIVLLSQDRLFHDGFD
jgi:hypothetical protein